ncbi:hypothetical protein [Actinoplanes regularis]|uniref:hypothetical protein n=1 Tax=Actinoplanes regularis TaxID=52697 RepID=UPI0024A3092C|nr:hypothetical protein [Actinoplanes regularis]GLW34080.1 hypothetical protein Areg01_70170 [Actinoplanes regularis]
MQVNISAPVPMWPVTDQTFLRSLIDRSLSLGEVAMALMMSDLTPVQARPSDDEVKGFAVQGLARAGFVRVRENSARLGRLNMADIALWQQGVPASDARRRQIAREQRQLRNGHGARAGQWYTDAASWVLADKLAPSWQRPAKLAAA